MIPKEVFNNTAYSIKLPYITGHSLEITCCPFKSNSEVELIIHSKTFIYFILKKISG